MARWARSSWIPAPVLAEIGIIATFSLTPLFSSSETMKFDVLTLLLTPEMSVLLSRMTSFWVLKSTLEMISRTVSQVVSKSRVRSIIPSTIEASEIFLNVLSIPIFSTTSEVSRRPAVSMNLNRIPSMFRVSSMVSRVVPWMSETIARSSPRRAFNSVLFPVFVAPAIATGTPFLIALPRRNESTSLVTCAMMAESSESSLDLSANSTSSSLKSSSSSIRETSSRSSERMSRSSDEKPPFIWLNAMRWAAAFCDEITSATASA